MLYNVLTQILQLSVMKETIYQEESVTDVDLTLLLVSHFNLLQHVKLDFILDQMVSVQLVELTSLLVPLLLHLPVFQDFTYKELLVLLVDQSQSVVNQ